MKKKIKVIAVMMLACMMLCSISASAADDRLGTIVDGSLLTEQTEVEAIGYPLARGAFLSSGLGGLTITGSRTVRVSGATDAYQYVDEIKVTLLLQRLVGSQWVTVNTLGPKTAYNAYTVSTAKTYSVSGGYYYRVVGSHVAIEGSTNEAISSCSNGVWVE